MKAKSIIPLAIVVSVLLAQVTFAAPPRYEIIDLGTLGGYSSRAYAINDAGQVVGMVHTTNHEIRAFLWDSIGGMIDLGTIDNLASTAGGINNNEQVVGALSIPGGIPRAFIWDSATGMVELGAGTASSINNAGQIAGEFLTVYDPAIHFFRSHACIWDSANDMIDLGTLGSPCPNSTCPDYSRALSINDAGQVVGSSSTTSGKVHAFLWDSISGMCDLGTLGGNRSWAGAINNVGHIVGNSYSVDDKYSSMHAFLWDSSTGMRDLGTLGGNISEACAINDHGQVVGHSYTIDNDYDSIRAFIWDSNNGMVPLDELLSADSVWTELRPHSINNRGQIVGHGVNETLQRLSAFLMTPVPPKIIYVDGDAAGANDGSSWEDAYNFLQDALAAAWSGDEIHVAQGIYTPDSNSANPNGSGDRTATFQLINGVTIKGGYAGTGEPEPNARDIELYETILSGDLAGNDEPNFVNYSENSYHVLTGTGMDASAVLDGATITGGNAKDQTNWIHVYGGGMLNENGSPTLTNCIFTKNFAVVDGGGMYNIDSSTTVTNCTFADNSVLVGGLVSQGGGMFNYGGRPMVTKCTFRGNSASLGGALFNWQSSPTISNCTFSENIAGSGGGMMNNDSNLKLTKCIFNGNSAQGSVAMIGVGGAVSNDESGITMTGCTFNSNFARHGSGGMYNYTSNLIITNCMFIGNYGGAIDNHKSSPILTNCTFNGNSTIWTGAAIYNYHNSQPTMTNCILWNDSNEIWNGDDSTITIIYSDVEIGWPGEGNIDADPCFVELGFWDANGVWVDGDYHLLPDSLCINAGDPNHPYDPNETDLDGEPRVIGGRIDMGAYEAPIFAEARILPRTINLASKGNWITCYIWLPDKYDVADIDPNSVFLEEQIKAEQLLVDQQAQVATARFNREDVQSILEVGDIKLKVTCQLADGTVFEGTDTIKVIDKAGGKSAK